MKMKIARSDDAPEKMLVDYTAICDCNNFEIHDKSLSSIKKDSIAHVKKCGGEVLIDQNVDFEINDSFKTISIKRR
jgi:hypothetical protein